MPFLNTSLPNSTNPENYSGDKENPEMKVVDVIQKLLLEHPGLDLIVRQKRRQGIPAPLVIKELAAVIGIPVQQLILLVNSIYLQEVAKIEKFWQVILKEGLRQKDQLILSPRKYEQFLEEAGFGIYREGGKPLLVRVQDNKVRHVIRKDIKNYVLSYIQSLPPEFDDIWRLDLEDKVRRSHKSLFEEGALEFLKEISNDFHQDTPSTAYFYFRNGFVQVNKQGITLRPYRELNKLIWESQVIDRDFALIDLEKDKTALKSDFYRFLCNITNNQEKRLQALQSFMGYLLHRYKVRTQAYAIILCDEQISNGPAGRTGKGIITQALKHIRKVVIIDGRNFRIENQFSFQRVQTDTEIIAFDDLDSNRFSFERLFSILTEGISIERKQAGEIYLPFEDAPKILISTNGVVLGEGSSFEGRMREIELYPHYSANFSPEQEFGRIMFDSWPTEQWQLFDNLMMNCCQFYLRNGVIRHQPINLKFRKLVEKTCPEFPEFMGTLELDTEYGRKALYLSFGERYGFDEKTLKTRTFNGWLKEWARFKDLTLVDTRRGPNLGPEVHRDYFIMFSKRNQASK